MSLKKVFRNLPSDQKTIWLAPFHLRAHDLAWSLPLAATTGVLINTDRRFLLREHSNSLAIQRSGHLADGGAIALAGLPALMYAWGSVNHLPRARETGLLTGEALINSLIVTEALKSALGRERPTATGADGRPFRQFGDPSLPSEHSVAAWTAASVIAHEYPGVLSQMLAYGTASAVSLARVSGRKHFPSDVAVGGILGWMIGRQIYRAHHDTDLDDGEYGRFVPSAPEGRFEGPQSGTTWVPIDSWVYPAIERLAATGYIDTAETGIRPWTRAECARLVQEAGEKFSAAESGPWAALYTRLAEEFAPEIDAGAVHPELRIEEIYTRAGGIGGQPLADDFHFGKTIVNDFGRPFGQGANAVAAISARSVAGPLAFYVRGEYQHAGTLTALPPAAQQAIVALEGLPFAPPQRTGTLDRFRLLDAYVSFNYRNNLISFGQQTLWWGPGADASFLAGNNAEPLPMLRISRASPFTLPSIFHLLGAIRVELFWGQLGGQQFVALFDGAGHRQVIGPPLHPHPMIQGEKISFKPTVNFEFGFGVTGVFSGPGFPLTLHTLLRSYSLGNASVTNPNDPGDRRSAFDWQYRVPGLRNWLTFYGDSFTEDEISPITFPRKSSFRSGLYLPRLPKLAQVDLRVEGIYTDIPSLDGVGVAYGNIHYLSGYTNYGQIIGNAIGREGRGVNVWAAWHPTALNKVELHYRNQRVNPEFLQGGNLSDFDAGATIAQSGGLVFSGKVQYEHWDFPLLSTTAKSNLSAAVQISYRPAQGRKIW
jgi:membrane-associated phospholipid phosphatase